MHATDRQWPIVIGWVIAMLAIFPVVFAVAYALTGISIQQMVSRVDWLSWDTCGNVYIVIVVLIYLVIFLIRYGFQARRREQRRTRALAGDVSAMPIVSALGDRSSEASADALSREPLALRWNNGDAITATAEGLRWQRSRRCAVSLVWSEARLLERWHGRFPAQRKMPEIAEYGYCLYASARKYIEWTDAPSGQAPGERLSWKEKEQLQETLLAIVTAHTHLPLRTATNPESAQDTQGQRRRFLRRFSLAGAAFVLAMILFPFATALLALVAPLTRSFALNLAMAVIIGGSGLALLVLVFKALLAILRPRTPAAPPVVNLPLISPAMMDDAKATIRVGPRLRDRLLNLLLTVVGLASGVYLVARALQDFPNTDFQHFSFTNFHALALYMFMLCALLGVMYVAMRTFSRATLFSADATGVHWGRGRKSQSIPWEDVATLTAIYSPPQRLESFKVTGAPPQSNTVDWPVNAQWASPPAGASTEDAGAQFAAIVAQRAGIQPTTRWE
jgi:hypothetical protein